MNQVLFFVQQMEAGLRRYQDTRTAVFNVLERVPSEGFFAEVKQFMAKTEARESTEVFCGRIKSPYRRALFILIQDGLLGHPVLSRLMELRSDLEDQAEIDIQAHIERLPMAMLIPLLLLQFPAFLLLLLGPILSHFLEALR